MKRKEMLVLIEISKELRSFLYLSKKISILSRDFIHQPTRELISEHKVSGRKLIDLHKELANLVAKKKKGDEDDKI